MFFIFLSAQSFAFGMERAGGEYGPAGGGSNRHGMLLGANHGGLPDSNDKDESRRRREIDPSREVERAGRLIADRRYEEAASVLELICRDYPKIDAAAEMLARCYLLTGRPREAVTLLERRIAEKPNHFALLKQLGNAYLDLGLKDKAVETWSRILTGKKENAGYYGIVAKLESEAGLYDEALATLREGRKFERHFSRFTMDIIRLERMLGRTRTAFREGILYLTKVKDPNIGQADFLFEIFRESGSPDVFIADIDSVAARNEGRRSFFKLLRALLLVDAGEYGGAESYLEGERDIGDNEFYIFLNYIAGMRYGKDDVGFHKFFTGSLSLFLERYINSPAAPGVILMEAIYQRESAARCDSLGDPFSVVALADSAMRHPRGAQYRERAAYLKAMVQLEDLHMPEEALETLDRMVWRDKGQIVRVEELRARALFAAGRWEAAQKRFSALSKDRDSTIAVLGQYSLGRLRFLSGGYGKAVEELSAFAEKYPWSKWANDALGTALMVKGAMAEGGGALDIYREALVMGERGNYDEAIDSLEALEARYAASMITPHAIFLESEFEELAGRPDRARENYIRLTEQFPLHEFAPRALERLGLLLEDANPEDAMRRYTDIMERYPNDPFLERVRNRYMALRKGSMFIGGDEEDR